MTGTVYTETVVFSPPQIFVSEAPYQIAIVALEDGHRVTARIAGNRVSIGDRVELAKLEKGIHYFKKL